ncbi:MAG: hypothetical protein Q9184_003811 [Pyrenodesmia sp. 2 TL-2023]
MAIVMLDYFDPEELGLQSWAVFSPRDVASFVNVGNTALRVANECLDKFSQSNETGEAASTTLGFTSAMGYGSVGMSGAIGVFFWATGSDIDRRVRSGISPKGVLQDFNLSTKADAVG